jgi:hypothetical protein
MKAKVKENKGVLMDALGKVAKIEGGEIMVVEP